MCQKLLIIYSFWIPNQTWLRTEKTHKTHISKNEYSNNQLQLWSVKIENTIKQ
jgi:hypothetical protein